MKEIEGGKENKYQEWRVRLFFKGSFLFDLRTLERKNPIKTC